MPIVRCPKCPASVHLTPYFRDGQRRYKSDYGPNFFEWCKKLVRTRGDPDKTPACPHMEKAIRAETLRLDGNA